MGSSGFVYGKFFSGEPRPAGYSLQDITASADAGAGTKLTKEAQQRQGAGHRLFCLRNGENAAARFWLGHGGSCKYKGTEHPLPDGSPYIYGLSLEQNGPDSVFSSDTLNPLLLCLQEYLGAEARGRLVLCASVPLPKMELAACQLYLIATYDSLMPHLNCSPVVRSQSLPEKAVDILRAHAPAFLSIASRLLSASRLRKYLIEGKLAGQRLRIAFNGPRNMACYYSGVIFSQVPSQVRLFPLCIATDRSSIDMEADWLVRSSQNMAHGTVLPAFCRSILSVGTSFDRFTQSLPKSAASDINKIMSGGFEAVISRDFFDFLLFYHSMYLPMVSTRHREHSLFLSFSELADLFNIGFILMVKRGQNPVAGMLSIERNRTVMAKTLGVAAGSATHTRAGANSAVLYYLIKYAYDKHLDTVDFGYSGPFGSDGVLRFKSKWGTKLVADRNTDLLCLNFRDEETKKRFSSALSPISLDSLGLYDPPGISS